MAAQTSASSSRASAKRAQRRAKRSESLSGSMRQFLTPEVWKQVKHDVTDKIERPFILIGRS